MSHSVLAVVHPKGHTLRVLRTAALAAVLLFPRISEAAGTAQVRLVYERGPDAEECADEAGLRRSIAKRLGYDPVDPSAPSSVAVTVSRSGSRFLAIVKLVDQDGVLIGTRSLDVREGGCEELIQAVSLSVGIAVDRVERSASHGAAPAKEPEDDEEDDEDEPSAAPPPSPTVQATRDSPPSRDLARPARVAPLAIQLAAGTSAWLGTAPAAAFGPTALVSVRAGRFDVGVEGQLELPASGRGTLTSGAVKTSLVGGGPQACFHVAPFFACVVTLIGWLSASAPGVAGTGEKDGVDLLAGARVGAAVPIARGFSVRASADLLATVYGPTVVVGGQDVWKPFPVAGGTQLGLAWTIP